MGIQPERPSAIHHPKATHPDLAIAKERARKAKQLSLAHGKVVAVLRHLRGESYGQKSCTRPDQYYLSFHQRMPKFLSQPIPSGNVVMACLR